MKIQRKELFQKLKYIFLLFLIGGMIGWLYEVMLHLFSSGTFINRGMLHGPWLPIYGLGCVLMTVMKKITGNKPIKYLLICVVTSGLLEYATSWIMEVIYHKRWWDYSHLPLNINGRIFVAGLVGFGIAGCFFAYFILPFIERKYQKVSAYMKNEFIIVIFVIFILDVFISFIFPNVGYGVTVR